jgi:phosphate transport system protein
MSKHLERDLEALEREILAQSSRVEGMIAKANTELERIADLAVNIAERTLALTEYADFEVPARLERMFVRAADMVHDALDAFVDLDVEAAREVCRRDDEVDDFNRQVIDEMLDTMRTRSDLVEAALHFFSVTRHVERIADCATNIAEDVIYLVEGEIARHHFENSRPAARDQ